MSIIATQGITARPGFFNRISQRISTSKFVQNARNVNPKLFIAGGTVIGIGALLAYLSTKMNGKNTFSPLNISGLNNNAGETPAAGKTLSFLA